MSEPTVADSSEYVQLEVTTDGIAYVTMNRPAVHNCFNEDVIARLTEIFVDIGHQDGVRAMILRGRGKSFSAGADLEWMQRAAHFTEDQNQEDARALAAMIAALDDCPKPTIACVQGAAYGGGVGLVAACDIAIAVERAQFCLSEVRLGLLPAVISPFVVNAIGPRAARRYFLTAERFDAQEAWRLGLVHKVVADDEALHAASDALVEQFLQAGPEAIAATKELIDKVAFVDPQDVRSYTARAIAERRASDEGREGVLAFLEKRKPSWSAERG